MSAQNNDTAGFGSQNINKLIFKYATPTILSMLTVSLYNLADQIFIGHAVGYMGNAAINAAFPIQSMVMGLALWIGDGTATYIAINLGAERRNEASKAISQSVILLGIISAITVAATYYFMEPILFTSGCTAPMYPYATEYTKYLLLGMPFHIFSCGINPSIRADGNPKYAMLSMMAGCGLNFILAPLMIFGLNMGMAGSALSTVIGQFFSMVLVLLYLPRLKSFSFEKKLVRFHNKLPLTVLRLGISSLMLNCCQIVNILIINRLLIYYGSLSTLGAESVFAAMGAAQKIVILSTNVTSGIGIGSQPIISFNRGALNFERVRQCYFSALKIAFIFSSAVFILTRIFPEEIMLIFGDTDPGFMTFGTAVLKIWMLTIILSAFQDVSTSFFQAIGRPYLAMLIPLARRILLILPLSYVLPQYWGVISILCATPVADVIVALVVLFLLRRSFREMRSGTFGDDGILTSKE